jgi:hypothetical protein
MLHFGNVALGRDGCGGGREVDKATGWLMRRGGDSQFAGAVIIMERSGRVPPRTSLLFFPEPLVMKFFAARLLAAAAMFAIAPSVQAQDSWIFQPSYYSHDPITQVRIAEPAVHGGPYYTRPQGAFVRSGYRNLNSIIPMGRLGNDQMNYWESWIQYGEQF